MDKGFVEPNSRSLLAIRRRDSFVDMTEIRQVSWALRPQLLCTGIVLGKDNGIIPYAKELLAALCLCDADFAAMDAVNVFLNLSN